MKYTVVLSNKPVDIVVTYKDIKSVRLKVFPNQEVKLSVPIDTPDIWIEKFLEDKRKWMEHKLVLFEKTKAIEKETHIRSGVSTRILGRQLTIRVLYADQKKIVKSDAELLMYTNSLENQEGIDKQFDNWWQKSAKQYYTLIMEKLYPIIGKHGISKPKIVVKKMQTLWGSCSRTHRNINLNYYLYKAPVPCVEYVILHELTHFLYPHHNKDFYEFITIHMPDWKERKKQLDYEIVLGV
ncbi:MAG: M48 family metallopeptidase [Peptococcaceae bacterium]|nr:M48 family metallopeptidase [Peptococcaceae bacterium]